MKYCPKCKTYKEETLFTVSRSTKSGLNPWCRECTRRASSLGYHKNKDKAKKRNSEYRKKHMKQYADYTRKWKERNPFAYLAHKAVWLAVDMGVLKPSPCHCGSESVQAHHDDYQRPYDIIWLCPQHHKDRHRIVNNLNR